MESFIRSASSSLQLDAGESEERIIRTKVTRLQRQAELHDDRKSFRFLVTAGSLRTVWGSVEVLIDQLQKILDLDLHTAELRICDDSKPNLYGAWGEYSVFDHGRLVFLESPWWCSWVRNESLARHSVQTFEEQWNQALRGDAVKRHIEGAIREVTAYEEGRLRLGGQIALA